MNRRIVVVLHQPLGNQNGVFKVVTTPGHERDQYVSSQRQFAAIRTRTIGDHLTFRDALAHVNDWPLIDTSILVRSLELNQRVDIRRHFAGNGAVDVVISLHDDTFRVDIIDDPVTSRDNHGARIARGDIFHARADVRCFRAQ